MSLNTNFPIPKKEHPNSMFSLCYDNSVDISALVFMHLCGLYTKKAFRLCNNTFVNLRLVFTKPKQVPNIFNCAIHIATGNITEQECTPVGCVLAAC